MRSVSPTTSRMPRSRCSGVAIQTYGIAKQYIRLTHSRMSREPGTGMPRVAITST